MKALLAIFTMMLVGCVSNPSVTVVSPDGTKMRLSTGMNLMAEVDEQVSEVEGNGYHLRHMVKRQDATRVPMGFFQMLVSKWLAGFTAHSQDLKTTTDGRVALGAQQVELGKAKIAADSAATAGEQANEALIIKKP